jgi:hypothetical protein
MPPFVEGQYVELYRTIPSDRGGSIPGGTRGIVKRIDRERGDLLRPFLANEKLDGQAAWLREIDLLPA